MFSAQEVKIIEEESKKLNQGWTIRINRNMICISFHIPIVILEKLDRMVKDGRYINRSEAIRSILRDSKEMRWDFDKMLVSETKIKSPIGKKRAICTRCIKTMVSVHYKNFDGKGNYKLKRIGFYCKDCEIFYPIEVKNTE